MIGTLAAKAFGSIWTLKRLCQDTTQPLLKHALIALYGLYQHEHSGSIAWNATFAGVPCLPHGAKGIFISGGARIGKNCVIFHQVTIGSNTLADSASLGAPIIGDACYIGAGAKIIGKVRIGHHVRIGANAVVYQDVPSNSVVVSGVQRVLPSAAPLNNTFYSLHEDYVGYVDGHWEPVRDEAILAKLRG